MNQSVVIRCHEVGVRYGALSVLEGVSFEVPARETLCIVGPNGGGKSTLLKVLLGLVRPGSGTVEVLGMSPRQARQRMGYMPQHIDIDPLFPINVEGIIRMGRLRASGWGFYSREDNLATERALDELDLQEVRREPFGNLSGGLKQRVLIARALVNEPDILLLDEPTAMVDAHIEAKLLGHLKELHKRMTILLVSHDAAFVSSLVDEVLCVNRTAALHPVQQVDDQALQRLYGDHVQAVIHGEHCHLHEPDQEQEDGHD